MSDSEVHSKANDFLDRILKNYPSLTIGDVIKEIRSECGPGMTLDELYARVNWGHTTIDNWQNHQPMPKFNQLGAMCMALGTHHYVIRRLLRIFSIDEPNKDKKDIWDELITFYLGEKVEWTKELSKNNFKRSFFSDEFTDWDKLASGEDEK